MAGGRRGGGQPKARGRKGRAWGWLVPFTIGFLAVPLLAAGVILATQARLPDLTLPSFGQDRGEDGMPAATPSPRATPRVAVPPTAPTPLPATPVRREAVPTAGTRSPAPTARPTGSAAAAPTATPSSKVLLRVPILRQQHALSCEAAALRMALATFGLQLPEDELLASLARDPTPRKVVDGNVQWGDPDVGFVGAWDGVFLQDGYGVYEKPIADLAMSLGYQAVRHGRNVDPGQLYAALREGYPSIVWMPYDLTVKGRGSWTTPAGKKIPYVVTEHAVVLAGIDVDGVYYADPMKSAFQRAPFAAFEKALAELGSRYVTVRP